MRKNSKLSKIIYLLIFIIILVLAYTYFSVFSVQKTNFDPLSLKVGDSVAGMKVKSIQAFSDIDKLTRAMPYSERNYYIKFEGETVLDGYYYYDNNDAFAGESFNFTFLVNKANKFPLDKNVKLKEKVIKFSNEKEAKKLLGIGSEAIGRMEKIVVDSCTVAAYPTEWIDYCRFISVKN